MSSKDKSSPWRVEWDESLSLGIPDIDAGHQLFISLVNELNQAIVSRLGMEEIGKRMHAILEEAASEFAHEEAQFKQWDYPGAAEHSQMHVQMALAIKEVMGRVERGCTEYELIETGLAVKAVLIDHLLIEDTKFLDWYRSTNPV